MFFELLKRLLNLLFRKNSETVNQQQIKHGDYITLAWGNKVSQKFRDRVVWIAHDLAVSADDLMALMAFESAETFSPSIRNAAGSGATGLIQFMPSTAKSLGTTTDELAKMSSEDQLNFVYKYLKPYKGRVKTLSDLYMAVLWPAAVGKPEDYVLFRQGTVAYRQNSGLDANKDGLITKAEAAAKVKSKLDRGLSVQFLWSGYVYPFG